ncbi:hypothetical protein QEZ48_00280 [Aquamicrobium lusatiense]|uniref:hypothetical protein n=1 Tax=Aquamicrobium lusatiense TaxID=89772 RepID=UPI0024582C7D|nr:hypothetical protein [Aquamicrobium lusatiense]MDH4989279.1 hypothetical protein [Aquamicrobium lusatiense]
MPLWLHQCIDTHIHPAVVPARRSAAELSNQIAETSSMVLNCAGIGAIAAIRRKTCMKLSCFLRGAAHMHAVPCPGWCSVMIVGGRMNIGNCHITATVAARHLRNRRYHAFSPKTEWEKRRLYLRLVRRRADMQKYQQRQHRS